MKLKFSFSVSAAALAVAFVFAGPSAWAENIATAASSAGKATITLVKGRVTAGALANAFNGKHGWAADYCLLTASEEDFTLPSEENPIIIDYVIADDFRPGEDIIASRFVIWGINNYYKDPYPSMAAKWYEIYGSNDGETWTKIVENKPISEHSKEYGNKFLDPAGAGKSNNIIVPWKNRASYRRYRFKFIANNGYTGTDRGQLFIQDINIMSDKVIHVSPDGSNDADGSSWESATTPTNAVRLANLVDYTEIHCKVGRYMLPASCVYTKRVIQIGGFSGNREKPLEMDPTGARSIYDGGGVIAYGFRDNTSAGNYLYGQFDHVENMEFCNMTVAGLNKTGSQGIECRNCRFVSNRTATGARGVHVDGQQESSVSKSRYFFYDCDFSGNGLTTGNTELKSAIYGYGIAAYKGRLYLDNCTFVSNGVPVDISQYVGGKSSYCPYGSALFADSTTLNAVGCKFIRNRGFTGKGNNNSIRGGACVYVTAGSSGVTKPISIHNCEFTGNEDISTSYGIGSSLGGLTIAGGANSTNEVVSCTFAYNISDGTEAAAGLTISSGLTVVSNSVFYGNKLGTSGTVGADLHLRGGKVIAGHTLFTSSATITAATAENLILGEGIIYGDPQFVTPIEEFNSSLATTGRIHFDAEKYADTLSFDVHLKTPSGYRKNGSEEWFTDALIASPAIDAGNPASDFSNEPIPNGGRINLGFYGNTAEASKTPPEATFKIAEIPTQIFDGVNACAPVPTLVDKTTGEVLDAGDFEFSYVNNNAYGTATITVTGREGTVNAGLKVSATFKIAACFRVTALSLETEGDGKSWESPMSLTNAIANAVRKEDVILVKAGVYPVTATISVPKPMTIRGGYAGTEGDQLAAEPETVLDGEDSFENTLMAVTAATDSLEEVTIENFAFVRSRKRGFSKSGITSLKLISCRIDSNKYSVSGTDLSGIGAYFSGTVGFTEVTLSNCVVRANQDAITGWKVVMGHGVYAANLGALKLFDTSFTSNGIAPSAAYSVTMANNYTVRGFALYATSAPVIARGCEFRLNRGYSEYPTDSRLNHGSIVCVVGKGSGTSFDHCLFAGNATYNTGGSNGPGNVDGTLYVTLDSVDSSATVNHCTFFGNIADTVGGTAGAYFGNGSFSLSNSVFAANIVGSYAENGADLHLASGQLSVSHCFFGGDNATFVSVADGATLVYEGGSGDIIYGNPRTVTPVEDVLAAISGSGEKSVPVCSSPLYFKTDAANLESVLGFDVHLLSGAGYRKNGSQEWFTDVNAVSCAIDAADASSPFELEPTPNGACANLGVYGNTPEASKSATGKPEIAGDIQVTYPDGYSQPLIAFDLGGESAFSATVTVNVYTNDVLLASYVTYGASLGDRVEYLLPHYLPKGAAFKIRVDASSVGGLSSRETDATVAAELPPWYGKGGPKNVIHVRPNATGSGSGENWTDAMTDLHAAMTALSAEKNEIWFAGTNICWNPYKTIALQSSAVVRGGFAGLENTIAERPDSLKSVVTGRRQIHTMDISSSYPLMIERIRFENSKAQGVSKSGSGDLILADCEIEGCGTRLGIAYGYGLSVSGAADSSQCVITNCVFAGNGIPHKSLNYPDANKSGLGFGASFRNLSRVTIDDSLFITNGVPFSQPLDTTHGYQQASGSAVYAENSPVTARGCRFVCNRAWSGEISGGTVRLAAGTGESAFTNCLWLANQNSVAGYNVVNEGGGGEIFFDPAAADASLDVTHCTFAGNLNDIASAGGGALNIRSGTAHVINSIFYGNIIPRGNGVRGTDVYVAQGASLTAEYSLFPTDDSSVICIDEGAEFVRGEGLVFGSPLFVSPVEDLRYMPITGQSVIAYPAAAIDYLKSLNVHLRGQTGYIDEERQVRVKAPGQESPAIDAGHPSSPYFNEPRKSWGYSGRRANLGFYGNTPYATATRRKGFVVSIRGGGSTTDTPSVDDLPVEIIGGGVAGVKPVGVEDVVICDQADNSVKIVRGNEVIWRWKGTEDPTLPEDMRSSFTSAPTECKVLEGGKYIAMVASGWAIIDVATTNAIAYGKGKGSPHSIDLLPNDVVVVASTDTWKWTDQGVYFYDISGDRAKSPNSQKRTYFYMDNPHGFYWDDTEKRLYISDTQGLHRCIYGYDGNTFTFEVERTWKIAELGLTYGHDLMLVPGARTLAMTTFEQIIFFDLDKQDWIKDNLLWRADAKAFDPHRDGEHFLVTVPKAGFDPKWTTDTVDTYSRTEGFRTYFVLPGSKIYKARWFNR